MDLVVTVAYLLCRIADTLEDEARGQVSERAELFHTLGRLVKLEPGWEERAAEFARRSARRSGPRRPPPRSSWSRGRPPSWRPCAGFPAGPTATSPPASGR
ncbi:MAG TPA: hypothetical protein VFE93_15390 [Myxococcaceae bacterium]|nr:hypothetical protein [Myxococcaceae bacterium]